MADNKSINSKDVDLAAVIVDGIASVFLLPPLTTFAVASVRSITQLNEEEFLEKLKLFLNEVDSTNSNKETFLKSLDKDADQFFQRLFKILDRIEDRDKASIIGRLFKATIEGKFHIEYFKTLCSIVDKTYIEAIYHLYDFRKIDIIHSRITKVDTYKLSNVERGGIEIQQLLGAGLIYENLKITSTERGYENEINQRTDYEFSKYGELLYAYGLNHSENK